jgi:hypothetical protein
MPIRYIVLAVSIALVSVNSFATIKKTESIIFSRPLSLSEKNIDAIVAETNAHEFFEETFELRVKCNRYKELKKTENKKPIHCDIVGAVKDDFSEGRSTLKR